MERKKIFRAALKVNEPEKDGNRAVFWPPGSFSLRFPRGRIAYLAMAGAIQMEIEVPGDLARFRLPRGVNDRLQGLLDKQDSGVELTPKERLEAEGLVDLAELLSLLRLRAQRNGR